MHSRTERVGKETLFYDSQTGQDLKVVKSVDITNECPRRKGKEKKKGSVILDYIETSKGLAVEVIDCYPGEDTGASVANYLSDLESLGSLVTINFGYLADKFGLTPSRLAEIVRQEAPPMNAEEKQST